MASEPTFAKLLLGMQARDLDARRAHVTASEITRQPDVWRSLAGHLRDRAAAVAAFLAEPLKENDLEIVLAGAGSSGFAGGIAAAAIRSQTGRAAQRIDTTDIVEAPRARLDPARPTLLVSFGRSGNSPESLAALRAAERHCHRLWHLAITCNPEGELARAASAGADRSGRHFSFTLPEASDQAFAMTGSFTAMTLAATALLGGTAPDHAVADIERLADEAERLLARTEEIRPLAERDFGRAVYLGAGLQRDAAAECALKLLELTDGEVASASWSALAFRHGPKTIVEPGSCVLSLLPAEDPARAYAFDMAREIVADGRATHVLLACEGRDPGGEVFRAGTAEMSDAHLAILYVVFGQLFAFFAALRRGHAVDAPSATGEVNRVVQNVTIYA